MPSSSTPSGPTGNAMLAVLASLAIALPTLIAFNLAPSATFFNQAAAFTGWGGGGTTNSMCVAMSKS